MGKQERVKIGIYTESEIMEILAEEQQFFIDYVETYWLSRYFKMVLMNHDEQVPFIVVKQREDLFTSKKPITRLTQEYQLQYIQAKKWLDIFHGEVDKLPTDYQDIIKMKYMNRRKDGRTLGDSVIHARLNMSRSAYYDFRKQVLEELGRALYGCTLD